MQYRTGPLQHTPTVVKNLVIINAIMLLVKYLGKGQLLGFHMDTVLGLHYISSPEFKPWQLVTHLFMHGNFWHLFMNMFGLFMLGAPLEYRWGSKRFLMYYFICGIGAALLYMGVQGWNYHELALTLTPENLALVKSQGPQAMMDLYMGGVGFDNTAMNDLAILLFTDLVGASGAVFGILVAFGMLYPNAELMIFPLPIPIKAKYFVILYGAYELYAGYAQQAGLAGHQGDNVAHFAHIGGLIVGFITIMIWKRRLPDT